MILIIRYTLLNNIRSMIICGINTRVRHCLLQPCLSYFFVIVIIECIIILHYLIVLCDFGNGYALVNDTPLDMYLNLDSKLYIA